MALDDPEKKQESPSEKVLDSVKEGMQVLGDDNLEGAMKTAADTIKEQEADLTNTPEYKIAYNSAYSKINHINSSTFGALRKELIPIFADVGVNENDITVNEMNKEVKIGKYEITASNSTGSIAEALKDIAKVYAKMKQEQTNN